jgi:plasmid stability protein
MAQVLIRDLDPGLVDRLKERARARGRSLEAELRGILEAAAPADPREARALAARIRRRLAGRATPTARRWRPRTAVGEERGRRLVGRAEVVRPRGPDLRRSPSRRGVELLAPDLLYPGGQHPLEEGRPG